ncbi:hypothetical protein G3M54_02265 [Bacillus megaterium NBRC 15308 = ATCC 14581]|nr:hypothetical protein [Priestia megaterium NBRC 15308 = ATCC 14581]
MLKEIEMLNLGINLCKQIKDLLEEIEQEIKVNIICNQRSTNHMRFALLQMINTNKSKKNPPID